MNLAANSAAAQHAKVLAAQSPAQRAAAARAAFRQQADKQLMVSFSNYMVKIGIYKHK